jgi:hypothetical protein
MPKSNIVLTKLMKQIESKGFKEKNRIAPTDFCRTRKLTFNCLVIAFINRLAKSSLIDINQKSSFTRIID